MINVRITRDAMIDGAHYMARSELVSLINDLIQVRDAIRIDLTPEEMAGTLGVIGTIKAIRARTGCSLFQAKDAFQEVMSALDS